MVKPLQFQTPVLAIMLTLALSQTIEASETKAIIFDLHKVISKTNNWSFIDSIGITTVLTYILEKKVLPWKLGPIIQDRLFAMLYRCDYQLEEGIIKSRAPTGEEAPALLSAYQAGKISAEDAREKIRETMATLRSEKFFSSETEATIIERAVLVTFTPETFAQGQIVMPQSAALLEELAALTNEHGQKKFKLIALSNWDKDSFPLFKSRFEHVFSSFDAIYISGDIGTFKPNASAFNHVLDTLGLDANECIFLDDQPENIEAAERLGIQSHLFTDANNARIFLKQRGIQITEATSEENRTIPILITIAATAGIILAYMW